jgi:hypothetical protein
VTDTYNVDVENLPSPRELIDAALEVQSKLTRSALLGGLAMMFYGSDRTTKDIDFTAASTQGVTGKPLSLGGVRFAASNGVEVDVLVIRGDYARLYAAAEANAVPVRLGKTSLTIRTVRPEYLAIIKIAAGREKDISDAKFLLSRKTFPMKRAEKLAYDYMGVYGAQELRQLAAIAKWERSASDAMVKKSKAKRKKTKKAKR